MLHYTVKQDGTGDFVTITDALQAVPYGESATVHIACGTYREKIFCDKEDITLRGENEQGVRIVYGDGAKHTHADGHAYGTFRSWTALFSGGRVQLEDLTIENDAGDGALHGQAIAAYMDAAHVVCRRVRFLGCQDTLFTAPLPEKERQERGFLGPREYTPRYDSVQYYEDCFIRGDIDFIFGGADALFRDCTLEMRNRGEKVNGWFAAPSTPANGVGYVFHRCHITGSEGTATGSAYLARPWRETGKAAFIECAMDEVVHPDGFDDWNGNGSKDTCAFAEYASSGAGSGKPRAFGTALTDEEAEKIIGYCEKEINPFL